MATPHELLARRLKEARVSAGYKSHTALARKIKMSRPVVSKAENPAQPVPTDIVLAAYARVTGVDLAELQELAERARHGTPEWFISFATAESSALTLRYWGPLLVPGIAQTEPYAREVLAVEAPTPERLAELLRTRMERQQVINRAHVVVAIDHGVLQRRIGSAEIMAEQCAHLVTLAELSNVTMHVVPEHSNHGVWAGLGIAMRDGSTTVNLSTGLNDVSTSASAQTDWALRAFDRVLGCAWPAAESLEYVRDMEGRWNQQV